MRITFFVSILLFINFLLLLLFDDMLVYCIFDSLTFLFLIIIYRILAKKYNDEIVLSVKNVNYLLKYLKFFIFVIDS